MSELGELARAISGLLFSLVGIGCMGVCILQTGDDRWRLLVVALLFLILGRMR